jgi:hypothetical protein
MRAHIDVSEASFPSLGFLFASFVLVADRETKSR